MGAVPTARRQLVMKDGPYDLIVVLGLRFQGHWHLRSDLKRRLDKTAELYKTGRTKAILVSGKWTIWFDWLHIKPPVTEALLMQHYLMRQGVPSDAIHLEQYSKDTVGNIYYLRLFLDRHPEFQRVLIVCAAQHKERIDFLVHKFFGPAARRITLYAMTARHYRQSALDKEAVLLRQEQEFLRTIPAGHLKYLRQSLYSLLTYRRQARAVEKGLQKPTGHLVG